MARHLARSVGLATLAAAIVLQGCEKRSPVAAERAPSAVVARDATRQPQAIPPAAPGGWNTSAALPAASEGPQEPTDEPPPWLAELLNAPDPNVRIVALDDWARQPGASLDPVIYALVDPEESVRARAQAVLEQELARR